MGMLRRVDANESINRLFVLDQMIELIDEYIGLEAATNVIDLYQSWALDQGGNYNEFKKLFEDIISSVEDLPEMVKWRFNMYIEHLFPPPLPG